MKSPSKHWIYAAGSGGPTIPGWGAFPPSGSHDVLGRVWTCDEGAGDDEVGCVSNNPADLSDSADSLASNTCAGWDPNTDTASDEFSSYSLRWPTVTDGRGSAFDATPWW